SSRPRRLAPPTGTECAASRLATKNAGFAWIQTEQIAAQPVQGDLRRQELDPVAIPPELVAPGHQAFWCGQTEADGPDGLLRGTAARTGDAGHCESEIAVQRSAPPRRHLARGLLTHCPVRPQGGFADTKPLPFDFVGIGNHAAFEILRAPRDIGE